MTKILADFQIDISVPLKIPQYSQEKDLGWILYFNKNAVFPACNFIKKRLQLRFFAANIAEFLRTSFLKNFCEQLFERFPT